MIQPNKVEQPVEMPRLFIATIEVQEEAKSELFGFTQSNSRSLSDLGMEQLSLVRPGTPLYENQLSRR